MDLLERYVADCENKRRRMRDRPSDAVVTELRVLLDFLKTARERQSSLERDLRDFPTSHGTLPHG